VHVRHIRQKLGSETGVTELIETVRGVGYRFKEDS
jgi:two-component system alkaline phosphatase synthesis response regulator PhoP